MRALLVNSLAALWLFGCGAATPPETPPVPAAVPVPSEKTPAEAVSAKPAVKLRIIAVGDIMLGTDYPDIRFADNDGKDLLAGVKAVLQDADITFGNLEGTILEGGEAAKACKNPQRCYVFRSPPRYTQYLVEAGFDVLSLANNHARDFGEAGRLATMANLDAAGIRHSGVMPGIASWQVKGRHVAMIAFAPFRGVHNMLDLDYMVKTVSEIASRHDIVMVSMHGGAEGEDKQNLPFAEEFYYGENRGDVVAFARAAVAAGADLVLGHGPHVPRAMELYQGRLIAYSLGNFATTWGINVRGANGLAPILRVQLDADGAFVKGRIISARQIRPAGPVLDPEHRAAKMIRRLTLEDFPHTPISISPQGEIRITQPTPAAAVIRQ